ncbi:MAG: PHP domain-containing protein [Succinivibrionaceae bacterium]|nr:PHP domain-containing protein [Succinivibrionaceae bacterium]
MVPAGFKIPPLPSDFHTHTCRSDGLYEPKQLAQAACDRGIRALAVTDHDNMNAVDEITGYVAEAGLDLKIIPGIEVSAQWRCKDWFPDFACKIHIVGLFCDPEKPDLAGIISRHKILRDERVVRIRDRLLENVPAMRPYQARLDQMLSDLQQRGTFVNRKHFADFMVSCGVASSVPDAMENYLYSGRPAAAGITYSDLRQVVEAIASAGGIPVLAHPLRYRTINDDARRGALLDALARDFRAAGGRGIEITSPVTSPAFADFNPENTARVAALAERYDLLCSMGSDCHGNDARNPERALGIHQFVPENLQAVWEDERFEGIYGL